MPRKTNVRRAALSIILVVELIVITIVKPAIYSSA